MERSRDSRRRRIVDRGTDRIALITGRIKALPSASESASESESDQPRGHSHTSSCPPSISQSPLLPSDQPSVSTDSPQSEDNIPGPLNRDSIHETEQKFLSGSRLGPYMRKCDSSTEPSREASSGLDSIGQSSQITEAFVGLDAFGQSSQITSTIPTPQVSTSNTVHHFEPQSHRHKSNIVTLNEVSSAFSATEITRIRCSLAMAMLVVLSYIGFPILGSQILKSIIFLRPLYLLLLTNATVVIAHLLIKQRGSMGPEQQATGVPSAGENGLADQLGNALELGLMLQNITGALFMDCSIYAITVTCGLSLAQILGW